MKLPFRQPTAARQLRQPLATTLPKLSSSSVSAMYRATRVGGDFYDVVPLGDSRLVFVILDVAGKREDALHIAASVQERFRQDVSRIFASTPLNENEAVTEITIATNRAVLEAAGGVRCTPAFLGCYDERFGTLVYINAGHTPAVVKDEDGITMLGAMGPPLGLFSHAALDAQVIILRPGAALVLVSKGLVEIRAGSAEYGAERLKEFLLAREFRTAQEICSGVLASVQQFVEQRRSLFRPAGISDDITTLALVRSPAAKAASAS